MTKGTKILCAHCQTEVSLVLGFSAPMTMPGQEEPTHFYQVKLLNPVSEDNGLQFCSSSEMAAASSHLPN
jgi:hypothetical protein